MVQSEEMVVVQVEKQLTELMSKCAINDIATRTNNCGSDSEKIVNKLDEIISLISIQWIIAH